MALSDTLTPVRYYTEFDPYIYTTDNRPLEDLKTRDDELAALIEAINDGTSDDLVQVSTSTLTSYSIILTDAGKYLRFNSVDPVTVIVPASADVAFPVGTLIHIRQVGAGQVTLQGSPDVTILTPDTLKLRKAGATVSIIKISPNEWEVYGDLEIIPEV